MVVSIKLTKMSIQTFINKFNSSVYGPYDDIDDLCLRQYLYKHSNPSVQDALDEILNNRYDGHLAEYNACRPFR